MISQRCDKSESTREVSPIRIERSSVRAPARGQKRARARASTNAQKHAECPLCARRTRAREHAPSATEKRRARARARVRAAAQPRAAAAAGSDVHRRRAAATCWRCAETAETRMSGHEVDPNMPAVRAAVCGAGRRSGERGGLEDGWTGGRGLRGWERGEGQGWRGWAARSRRPWVPRARLRMSTPFSVCGSMQVNRASLMICVLNHIDGHVISSI